MRINVVQIVQTLDSALTSVSPEPDTLCLKSVVRLKLCFLLLDRSIPSWRDLADVIGKLILTI